MRTFLAAALALLFPALALAAAPGKLGYQGRLLKGDGTPESGVVALRFALFEVPAAGAAIWEEDQQLALSEGFYATLLGESKALPESSFDGRDLYLEVALAGSPLSPRARLASVPYALRAASAASLSGGKVEASEVWVGGKKVVDSSGKLAGDAAYQAGSGLELSGATFSLVTSCAAGQTLLWDGSAWNCGEPGSDYSAASGGGLSLSGTAFSLITSCSSGQTLLWNGSAWACGKPGSDYTAAAGGGLALSGTAFSLVTSCAAGQTLLWSGSAWSCGKPGSDYTAAAGGGLALTGTAFSLKACSAGQLLKHDGSAWACADAAAPAAHGHSAADLTSGTLAKARLPALTAADVGAIAAGGGVPVGDSATCDTGAAGTLRFKAGVLAVCDGKAWRAIPYGGMEGLSAGTAARDCKALLAARPSAITGLYWINPAGGSPANAFEAWCDMSTSGGGWTLIASQNDVYTDDMASHFDQTIPRPGVLGVRGYWMNVDLKPLVAELRVTNTSGESFVFKTADFDGPLKFNDANFVDAADENWKGVIAGKSQPVVSHYQVGQECASAGCRKSIGSSSSYSAGFLIVFDWNFNEGSTSTAQHAHFGGNANLESGWSRRGAELWIR